MKLTWTDQYTMAKQLAGVTDTASLTRLKRDMNIGATKFLAALGREYNRHSRFTNLVANQQYYQFPADGQKLKEVIVSTGTYNPPMEQIPDELAWRFMNMLSVTSQPTHFWIRGNNEFGLYPIPSASITNGIEMVFSPKHVEQTEDDVTGTCTVSNGSTTVTNSGTTFTQKMEGQWFQITDGTDERWYRIKTYTSSSVIVLENYYQGTSGSGRSFRIGQVMDLPEECLEGPVDYALYRFYLMRGDSNRAVEFKALYQDALELAQNTYANVTESQVVVAEPQFRTYNPFRGDPPNNITA